MPQVEFRPGEDDRRRPGGVVCGLALAAGLLASGCAVTLHGHESAGQGATISSSVSAAGQSGHARVGASFGLPASPRAPGGTLALTRGASAVLLLGLVLGDVAEYLGSTSRDAAEPVPGRTAAGGISHTCSCYGWRPGLTEPVPTR